METQKQDMDAMQTKKKKYGKSMAEIPKGAGEETMPIKNYTTKIDVHKTLGEIHGMLAQHGARKVMFDYDDAGKISAICFSIITPMGEQGVRLPANVEAAYKVLQEQGVRCDREQAARVAWRIVKDWVDAQMAILETEMVNMDEVFLPYMLDRSGNTLYQLYQQNQLLLEGQ